MSVISNFMKRFGWVRISEVEQLQTTHDNWSFVPEAPIDAAAAFDPTLAAGSQETPALDVMNDPDENAWLAAVAKAKAQSEAEAAPEANTLEADTEQDHACAEPQAESPAGEEDWDALMRAALQRADAEVADTAPSAPAPEAEEDWDALMQAALDRAEDKPLPEPSPPAEEPQVDAAAAQVEQGSRPANDDRPAVKLVSVPAKQEEEEGEGEWQKLRAQVEARENAETERKMRAMREIRRLRGSRGRTRNGRPPGVPRPRLAAGTTPPPRKANEQPAMVIAPAPVVAPAPRVEVPASPLPRITKRLKR